jgi:hypothetical protein
MHIEYYKMYWHAPPALLSNIMPGLSIEEVCGFTFHFKSNKRKFKC